MAAIQFKKAVKTDAKLRLAIMAPSGAGKTFTALEFGRSLVGNEGRIVVLDTEKGSAAKYADVHDFDHYEMEAPFNMNNYINAIKAAEEAGYDLIIVDSLSHAWEGPGGAKEMVDAEAARMKSNNSFTAWGKITPQWNELLRAVVECRTHIIGTMRTKMAHVLEERNGKQVPVRVGMAPIFREGSEYEFDVVSEMDLDHRLIVIKTRCREIDGAVIDRPGAQLAHTLKDWLQGVLPPEIEECNEIGLEMYGSDWPTKSRELVSALSGGSIENIKLLTRREASDLLSKMRARHERLKRETNGVNGAKPSEIQQEEEEKVPPVFGLKDRPAPAGTIVLALQEDAANDGRKATAGQRTIVARALTTLDKNGQNITAFLRGVYDIGSVNEMTIGQALALEKWLVTGKDKKDVLLDPNAKSEYKEILLKIKEDAAVPA